MASGQPTSSILKTTLLPLALLAASAAGLAALLAVDAARVGADPAVLMDLDPAAAAATIGSAGEIVAAILALAITVVAIVVEMSSNRYTHRVADLFVRAPVNFLVMGFYILTACQALLVSLAFDYNDQGQPEYVPILGVWVASGMLLLAVLSLLPYFAFVFAFLNPLNIIARIRQQTIRHLSRSRGDTSAKKQEALRGIEQLADLGQSALTSREKGVSVACVDALGELVGEYQTLNQRLPPAWFEVDGELAHDLDFVSLSPELLEQITADRTWFEMKVLRRYEALFRVAVGDSPDINHLVAIWTRRLVEGTPKGEVSALAVRFFNTYLRIALNAGDPRTAYNVLQQYRLLAAHALDYDDGVLTLSIGEHLLYYARLAFQLDQRFVVETIGQDFRLLCEAAYDKRSLITPALLKQFLRLDGEIHLDGDEDLALRGVRKAQAQLATFYLQRNDEKPARAIWADMKDEPISRIASIRAELMRVTEPQFWEINDRGVNFEYLPEERRALLDVFFGWFKGLDQTRAPQNTSLILDQTLKPTPLRHLLDELD